MNTAPQDTERPPLRPRVHAVLSGTHHRWGRPYGLFNAAVIVLAVVVYIISTLPDLPAGVLTALHAAEWFVICAFGADYFARIWASPRPSGYIFSFWGIVDFVAFAPALLVAGTEMTSTRLLRLVQLARLLKLMRLAHAYDQLVAAIRDVREQLLVFLVLTLITLVLCSIGIYQFEHEAQPEVFVSVPHSLWWAVATLSTVGYGDMYPVTAGGRFFTALVLLIGLAVIAVPTGLISAALVSRVRTAKEDRHDDEKT